MMYKDAANLLEIDFIFYFLPFENDISQDYSENDIHEFFLPGSFLYMHDHTSVMILNSEHVLLATIFQINDLTSNIDFYVV